MDSDTLPQIRIWPFRNAPAEMQALFPKGSDDDWVVHVARPELLPLAEHSLLRWRRIFPVSEAMHPRGGVVYWGAETQGLASIVESGKPPIGTPPPGDERRMAPRVPLEFPIRYETGTEPQQVGFGHTVDVSVTGISFTTESWLPVGGNATIYVTWPVRLEGDIPVVFSAAGRLVRSDATKAAVQLETTNFSIAT